MNSRRCPRHRQLLAGARAALPVARLPGAGELRADVGAERHQLQVVAAVQRQLHDAPVLDDGADRGVGRLDERRLAGDGRHFRDCPQLDREVDARGLLHLQLEAARNGLEPFELGLDGVLARRQRGEVEQPDGIGDRRARRVGRLVHDRHSGAGDDGAGRILHFSGNRAQGLSERNVREAGPQDNRRRGSTHGVTSLGGPG